MHNKLPFTLRIRLFMLSILFTGVSTLTYAQVKGISYTLSPTAEYTFWDKTTGISNGYLGGGQLGFGFGEFVELRASYLQSFNLKRDFSALSADGLRNAALDTHNVDIQRWGGDLKINLSQGGIVPYLTVGTGVQTIDPDSLSRYRNIYFSAGGGLQFSVADRFTFGVQAVNTSFNDSPARSLMSDAERTANGITEADYPNELLKNWSVRASMILYLGGRRPGSLTEADKAYLNNFSSGVSLPVEVTAGQLNFGEGLPYANTRYVGVSSGFNFGPYVGIRGFYWRGMEEGYFSTFDKLAVYGGEGKFKLSNGQGLTPHLSVGGGVIDALEGYQVDGVAVDVDNKPFVSGGLGLDLPFSRALKLTAYAKALLTSNSLLEQTANPDELTTSWAYGLSMNFVLGNGAKTPESMSQETTTYDGVVMSNLQAEKRSSEDLKREYEARIEKLETEIAAAKSEGNASAEKTKGTEKASIEEIVQRIVEAQNKEKEANQEAYNNNDALLLNMKPTEFRAMIDEIKASNEKYQSEVKQSLKAYQEAEAASRERIGERLTTIETNLDSMQNQAVEVVQVSDTVTINRNSAVLRSSILDFKKSNEAYQTKIQKQLEALEKSDKQNVDQLNKRIQSLERTLEKLEKDKQKDQEKFRKEVLDGLDSLKINMNKVGYMPMNSGSTADEVRRVSAPIENYRSEEQMAYESEKIATDGFFGRLNYDGVSVVGGLNFGGATTLNVGFRGHYRYQESSFYLMPETYIGLGNPSSYGVLLNAVYQLENDKLKDFAPYAGIGAGILRTGDENLKLGSNIVIGANLFNVAGGRFYVDVSGRNLFKNTQFSAGYRLPF